MSFEAHRAKLVELIDRCIYLFENDPQYNCFNLDGQTIVLEDYLEIKPDNAEKLKKYVSDGKLTVGPWYVLQDEFLTSGEANVRNLLVGTAIAKKFGRVNKVGYFPDTFGNVGQMPQLMKQAGMEAIMFGRGVKPTGFANEVYDFEEYSSQFSEMYWEAPDGSSLPAILFANWYNNGAEIPVDGDRKYWEQKLMEVTYYASTNQLLLMNGSDHQPVQLDLSTAIEAAKKNYPDYDFVHSSYMDYVEAVKREFSEKLTTIKGELTSQNTNGWMTLINTASSHADLKRMNREGEILLESVAEPLAVIAMMLGMEYPGEMLLYSWKKLMQNHAHDSICGCSIDDVNDEMEMRFVKSRQAVKTVVDKSLDYIAGKLDIKGFEDCAAVFSVINTYSKKRTQVVSVDVDLERFFGTDYLNSSADVLLNRVELPEFELIDGDNNVIPCDIKFNLPKFGYLLPEDKFRVPYMADNVTVTFEVTDVDMFGYKTYGLRKRTIEQKQDSLVTERNKMENEYISVTINADGTVDVTDKKSGKILKNILCYEDSGDIGNEYMFMPVKDDKPICSNEGKAEISLVSDTEFEAKYQIVSKMTVPVSADELHEKEVVKALAFPSRRSGRSEEKTQIEVKTLVSLERKSRGIKVKTQFVNTAKDHRLRVVIPTQMDFETHRVETVFEVVERSNKKGEQWTYPSRCDRQQGFLMVEDEQIGVVVANKGIYEYEILDDNSIALSLVRAVGDLGDWGSFPTERSQCLKNLEFDYEVLFYDDANEAYEKALSIQYPLMSVQHFECGGEENINGRILWSGECLKMTSLKKSDSGNDVIMRWVNYSDEAQKLSVQKTEWITNLYMSNVIEEKLAELQPSENVWEIEVKPFEIVTFGTSL